jgi:hypothetical protein
MRSNTRYVLALLSAWLTFLPPSGIAQTTASHAPPNTPITKRIAGTLARVDGNELLIAVKGGTTETYQLSPSIQILQSRPGLMSDLSTGKIVGCTNIFSQGAAGLAGECRIFPDTLHGFAGGRGTPDSATTPTINGTITDARDAGGSAPAKGRRILIRISTENGTTALTVSALTEISVVNAGDASLLKRGAKLRGVSEQAADGTGVIQVLTVMSAAASSSR